MKTKTSFLLIALVAIVLNACAPAPMRTAAPAAAPQQTAPEAAPAAPAAQPPSKPANPAPAPAATSAPSAPYQPAAGPSRQGALPPRDNFFQNYGINTFQDTYEDHLSTFGLDVDTASYTVARAYVLEGNLPPQDAVRVEEFVNYFDPGYANPEGTTFGIYADGAPSPFHEDGSVLLRVGIQGTTLPENQRKPLNLVFVVDTSGSMEQDGRLELVKQALQLLVERLRPEDTLAIAAYSSTARVVLSPTSGANRDLILNSLYQLTPQNSTNLADGLAVGYKLAMEMASPQAENRLILCSDGVANVGATDANSILESVHGYVSEGILLNTVGVGMGNFNDVLLEQLADRGNGSYAYIDTMEEARKVFVEDLVATLQTIALDAKVQVDFNPDTVAAYRLLGYENRAVADQDFRSESVDAGEMGPGHSATAVYALHLRAGASGRLATVQLRWQDPTSRQPVEINGNVNTWDLSTRFDETDAHYRLAVVAAQYAEILRGSPWAQTTSLAQVARSAHKLASLLPEDSDVAEFAKLTARAAEIYKVNWQ
jgi:Ca-activated chloride channel homolog